MKKQIGTLLILLCMIFAWSLFAEEQKETSTLSVKCDSAVEQPNSATSDSLDSEVVLHSIDFSILGPEPTTQAISSCVEGAFCKRQSDCGDGDCSAIDGCLCS